MKELLLALSVWASAATGLPMKPPPDVVFMDSESLNAIVFEDRAAPLGMQATAFYKDGRIVLPSDWRADDIASVSTLVHELVHWLQDGIERPGTCRGDSERQAYEAQFTFLRAAGLDPYATSNISPIHLFLLTACMEDHR